MQTLRSRGLNPFRWSEYTITAGGVRFREGDIRGTREGEVEYDCIGNQPTYFSYRSVVALVGTLLFLTLSAVVGFVEWRGGDTDQYAWLVWLGMAAVVFVYYESTKSSGYLLKSNFGALVIQGKRSKVEPFVAAIAERKLTFIEDRISKRLSVVEPSEVDRYLLALFEGGVISEDQYGAIRSRTGLHDAQDARIGFGV
jgi:hypothetical protein